MAENNNETKRPDGVAVAGRVVKKTYWPAKDGKDPSWSIDIAYYGGRTTVNLPSERYEVIKLDSDIVLPISQRASGSKIYSDYVSPRM
jgi:hypothetical protein